MSPKIADLSLKALDSICHPLLVLHQLSSELYQDLVCLRSLATLRCIAHDKNISRERVDETAKHIVELVENPGLLLVGFFDLVLLDLVINFFNGGDKEVEEDHAVDRD